MLKARLLVVLTGLLPLVAAASDTDDFIAARLKHKIGSVATPQVMRELSGEAYLEVSGKVYGSIRGENGAISLLVKFGDFSQVVESKKTPKWAEIGESDVRLIVRAVKTELQTLPSLDLVASMTELDAMVLDDKLTLEAERKAEEARKKAETARIQRELNEQSRGTARFGRDLIENPITGMVRGTELASELSAIVPDYMSLILAQNKGLPLKQAQLIAECVIVYSSHYGVDARLVMALIQHESNFNPNSTSHKGAQGLGQLMPDTAKGLGISNAYDIEQNIYGTVRTIKGHLERQSKEAKDTGDLLVRALSAYNAGPGAVAKYGGMPPFAETRAYVDRVIKTYIKLCGKA
jgi:soluble lytic murein transglycosylase-like protein